MIDLHRLNDKEIAALLAAENTIHTNSHFIGTSGKHLNAYVDKDMVGMNTSTLEKLAYELAHRILNTTDIYDIAAVIGAPMGAIALASRVTCFLNEFCPHSDGSFIRSIFAEKVDGSKDLKLRDKFVKIITGKKVINIEDILNTGDTAEKLAKLVKDSGGTIAAVGALCNRGGVTAKQLSSPVLESLMNISLDAYIPEECPLCKERVPMRTDLGHGKKFIEERAAAGDDYPVAA